MLETCLKKIVKKYMLTFPHRLNFLQDNFVVIKIMYFIFTKIKKEF